MTELITRQWRGMSRAQRLASASLLCLLVAGVAVFMAYADPPDSDSDGMSDRYEMFFGLDPTNAADASANYDDDKLVNLEEYALWTDPFEGDTDRDGFLDDKDSNATSRVYINWGDTFFTSNNTYDYAGPSWWVAAYKQDGQWVTNPDAWHVSSSVSNDVGALYIEVDRSLLTNDAVLEFDFFDHTNASLYLDLYDTNGVIIVTNLFSNIMAGTNDSVSALLAIPFETYTAAAGIQIRRGIGEVTVYESLLYVDKDGDGLDKEQEEQLGSSDNDTDSDDDGLGDYAEVFTYGTSPADSDTDNDGLTDYAEVNTHNTDPLLWDSDGDGLSDGFEITYSLNALGTPATNLVGRWLLDEASDATVADSSAAGNHGTIVGASHVSGVLSNALSFDGADDAVAVANASDYKPANLTIALRMNLNALFGNTVTNGASDGMMVLLAQKNQSVGYAYSIYKSERNSLVFEVADSNYTAAVETSDDFVTTGTWYHVACTYDGSDLAMYVDGEVIGTATYSEALEYDTSSGLSLAAPLAGVGGGYLNGILDDIKVFSVALSSSQIDSLEDGLSDSDSDGLTAIEEQSAGSDPGDTDSDDDGLSDYAEVVTYGTDPADSDSDNDGLSDSAEVNTHNTDPLDADSDNDGMSDGWEVNNSLDPNSVALPAAAGHWALDETNGAVAADSSTNNNDGTIDGASSVLGLIGGARRFDGTDDSVAITNSADYKPSLLTVSLNISLDGLFGNTVSNGVEDGTMLLIGQKNAGSGYAYAIYKTGRNSIVFEVGNSASNVSAIVETADDFIAAGKWYHLVASYDGSDVELYVDNEIIGSTSFSAGLEYDGSSGLQFGAPPAGIDGGHLDGALDDVRVYGQVLSAGQMAALYERSADTDEDGLGNIAEHDNGTDPSDLDSDNDTYTDGYEVALGSDPNDDNSVPVTEVQVSGQITYSGRQTGTIYTLVATASGSWSTAYSGTLPTPGSYAITNAPVVQDLWLKAFRDSNANGARDTTEAQVEYGSNPLYLKVPLSGADLVLADPDTDSDSLFDWWEVAHFGDLTQSATNDPDSDGLSNAAEYQYDLVPDNADTDGDGLNDGWMITNGFTADTIPDANLVGLWRMDETSGVTVVDSSTSSNNGTMSGASHVSGWLGNGLGFDGIDDSLTIANASDYKTPEVTIVARVNFSALFGNTVTNGAEDGTMVFIAQKNATNGYGYAIYKTERNSLVLEVANSASNETTQIETADDFVMTGRWYQVAGTYDGSTLSFYVDGELLGTASHASGLEYDASTGLVLAAPVATVVGGHLAGVLDDVMVFDAALSATQVSELNSAANDPDGDDLINRDEATAGTDPNDFDSDDDGLADGEEALYGLDPLDADYDNDGLNDGDEVNTYKTDPKDSDTDDDGLSDGDEVNTYSTSPTDTDTDNDGLDDYAEVVTYGSDPLDTDTDNDGVTDGDEVNLYSLDPTVFDSDSDGDGLTNNDEVNTYGTSPILTDSDSDGTNDYYMVLAFAGTNTSWRVGSWAEDGDLLYAQANARARVQYLAQIVTADMYWLGINITNMAVSATNSYQFRIHLLIDEIPIEWLVIDVAPGMNVWEYTRTPWLSATNHTIRFAWPEQSNTNMLLGIEQVVVKGIDAPDSNTNGRQDWVDAALLGDGDTDSDSVSDNTEVTSWGTEPIGIDTDGDTLEDGEEVSLFGTDPLSTDSDTNGIADAVLVLEKDGVDTSYRYVIDYRSEWEDVDGSLVSYGDNAYACYDFVITNASVYRLGLQLHGYENDPPDNYLYVVNASMNGHFFGHFSVRADIDLSGVDYISTPWLSVGTHRIELQWINDVAAAGRATEIVIEKLKLYQVDGPDANTNGIQDWMETELAGSGDIDGDGLSDYDEVVIYGTSPVLVDSDFDGLTDSEEVALGLDPADSDTDGDGVSDGVEIAQSYTDATTNDFDGTMINVVVLNGSDATTNTVGKWGTAGTSIYALDFRGSVEYVFTLSTNGTYGVEVEGVQHNSLTTRDTFDLVLYVDDVVSGRQLLKAPYGQNGKALFFTPELSAGSHTVRIKWINTDINTFLEIVAVRIQSFGGPDNDSNGKPDWLDNRLSAVSGFDGIAATSLVSPACLEGESRYQDLLEIDISYVPDGQTQQVVTVQPGIDMGWYADIFLSPTNATTIDITEQNGEVSYSTNVVWQQLNLLAGAYTNVVLREDDSLLLTAYPAGATNGTVTIEIIQGTNTLTNVVTTIYDPVSYAFLQATNYTVSGSYSNESLITNDTIVVHAVGGGFNGDALCVVGQTRTWDCPDMPVEAVIEHDERLTVTTNALAGGGLEFSIETPTDTVLYLLARLGAQGPIIDNAAVRGIESDSGEYAQTVAVFDDGSRLIQVELRLTDVPADLVVELTVAAGGVTFDDGTIEKILVAADFDELGRYTYYFLLGPNVASAMCHHIVIYDEDE